MKIIRAKTIDPADSGVYVKLSNMEALLLRNMCANISVLQGPPSLIDAAKVMKEAFRSVYSHVNPPLCASNYKFMGNAEVNMANSLQNLGDF